MATFSEIGSGGGIVAGCGFITFVKSYVTLFGPGDITYNIDKAKVGVLERVVIKTQKVINEKRTGGLFQVMYVDTLNGLWNEWDLVSHAEAIAIATAYYEDLLEDAAELKVC